MRRIRPLTSGWACAWDDADWAELDGGYRAVVCHAALYCIPALLAEAEATGARLRDLLLALVVGYEVVARTAHAFSFPGLVLHPHGGLATVGAAAAVAKLRGMDAETSAKAIATAATLCLPGPFNHAVSGALIRNRLAGDLRPERHPRRRLGPHRPHWQSLVVVQGLCRHLGR